MKAFKKFFKVFKDDIDEFFGIFQVKLSFKKSFLLTCNEQIQ